MPPDKTPPVSGPGISRFFLFGLLGAATAGLADVGLALWRSADFVSVPGGLVGLLFGASSLAPAGAALGVPAALLGRRLRPALAWSLLRRPRNAALVGVALGALSAAAIVAGYRRGIMIDAVDFRPLGLLALFAAVLGVPALFRRAGAASGARTAVALLALNLAVFGLALPRVGREANLPHLLGRETAAVSWVVRGIWWVFDRDGDGFPTVLCSTDCDCDDSNPLINPGAAEIPDNDVDENCSGYDLKSPVEPPPAARPADPGCEYPPGFSPPHNIVLITIDALRADRMGAYGHHRDTSPNLDRFASENVRFAEMRSQGSSTRHVFPVLLTGRYFPAIRLTKGPKWWSLDRENTTFAEILRDRGYRTVAVLPYFRFRKQSGFHQGFDVWETELDPARDPTWEPTGDLVTDRGIRHLGNLAAGRDPWLLWLHYFDPHASYVRHRDQPSFGRARADLYDGEILYVDRQVARFFAALRDAGLWDETAIIVTADHGEGIGLETDRFNYHGYTLFDYETRIPLLLRAPGVGPGVVEQSVSLIDLPPTILELGGAGIPAGMHGRSLVPLALGSPERRAPFLMHLPEKDEWEAIVDWPYKLIWEKRPNRFRLYHLGDDPHEQRDLAEDLPGETARLKEAMQLMSYRLTAG